MSGSSELQEEISTKEVKELQEAIQENTVKLKEAQQGRLRAEEEIINSRRETEQRVELVMEKGEVVDALQQLGHLLQEEMHLSEQLNCQAAPDRSEMALLEERSKSATNKAKDLVAEIQEVKRRLTDIKACNMAAQALITLPASKSKRNQGKQ